MKNIMLDNRLSNAAKTISFEALEDIATNYSRTGSPIEDARAELYMPYHNQLHTLNVIDDILLLSEVLDLTRYERDVAVCAGSAHDIVHDLGMGFGENEAQSAQWLVGKMERSGEFTQFMTKMGELAVLGTITTVAHINGVYLFQQAYKEQQFPSKRTRLVAEVVAAADLGRLLQLDGPFLAHQMYRERVCGASAYEPKVDEKCIEFLAQQADITGTFRFDNVSIDKVLASKRKEVHTYSIELLELVKSGVIDSWKQLVARDRDFMRQN